MTESRFDPYTYLADIHADIPAFDELQAAVADATRDLDVQRMLELGTGTGETARRILAQHSGATLVGIDESEEMLVAAREQLDADLRVARLQDPLPRGPFDLVFSALCIHHLDGPGKADLFHRVAAVTDRFVYGDVVVPDDPADAITPLSPDFDLPSPVPDQLAALRDAGFDASVVWSHRDLAVIAAN